MPLLETGSRPHGLGSRTTEQGGFLPHRQDVFWSAKLRTILLTKGGMRGARMGPPAQPSFAHHLPVQGAASSSLVATDDLGRGTSAPPLF